MECAICLCEINAISANLKQCNICKYKFHLDCVKRLDTCPMCRSSFLPSQCIESNVQFNNMNIQDSHDINSILSRFGRQSCLDNKHMFYLETLGDWKLGDDNRLSFTYSCMHVECKDCKIKTIMQ